MVCTGESDIRKECGDVDERTSARCFLALSLDRLKTRLRLRPAADPSIRGACFVVASDSHPHVLPMYAPVRALAPPRTHRLLDGQVNQIDTTSPTDYGPVEFT